MRHFLLSISRLLALALWFASSPAIAKEEMPDFTTPYAALLQAYVHPGEKEGFRGALVDYKGWAADKHHAEAMEQLKRVKPDKLSRAERTAFWINAYNLLTIDLIVQNPQIETIRNIGSVLDNPWRTFTWEIGGKTLTLEQIEREMLPIRNDQRLHIALANATLSGPDLRNEPYKAERLEAQLDDQVKSFLKNDKKGLKARGTVLEVSKIFQQFAPEFESKGGVLRFLRQYQPFVPANGVVQGYFEYNWNLNGTW